MFYVGSCRMGVSCAPQSHSMEVAQVQEMRQATLWAWVHAIRSLEL